MHSTFSAPIPGARLAVVEGRGHEIYVDDSEACIAALLKILHLQRE